MYATYFLIHLLISAQAPAADSSLTSWSCSIHTLVSGKDCVFEFTANPASDSAAARRQNVEMARRLASTACAKAGRPTEGQGADKFLSEMCQRDFFAAATSCELAGKWPLLDAEGRFAPSARACYRVLQDILQRTLLMAAVSSGCCQCLLSSHCSEAGRQCYQNLAGGTPSSSELACMQGACSNYCENAIVPSEPPLPTNIKGRKLP